MALSFDSSVGGNVRLVVATAAVILQQYFAPLPLWAHCCQRQNWPLLLTARQCAKRFAVVWFRASPAMPIHAHAGQPQDLSVAA